MFAEQCAVFYRMTIRKHHPTTLSAKVETQDFASHEGVYAIIVKLLLNECIAIGRTGDATFCVSTGLAPLSE